MEDSKKQLIEFIKENNKVFLSLVHPDLYGPLRGVNGILNNPDAEELAEMLETPGESVQTDLIMKTHAKTFMATRILVLPLESIKEAEFNPGEFDTLEEVINHMDSVIDVAPDLEKDPFYFRRGKI